MEEHTENNFTAGDMADSYSRGYMAAIKYIQEKIDELTESNS